MLSKPIRTDAKSLAELEQEVKDGSMEAQRMLEAIDSTLNHFNIHKDRELAAKPLLAFVNTDRSRWGLSDPKLQILDKMIAHLEKLTR